jgi:hypothetical protein
MEEGILVLLISQINSNPLPAGIDGGSADKPRQNSLIHNHLVVQGTEEGHFRLPDDLDPVEPVLERVDHNQHVAEFGGDNTTPREPA